MNHYPRWQEKGIRQALTSRRVLVLEGPRQCGKTTLAKALSAADSIYRTLDDVTLLDAALSDPHGFVRHGNQLMIIDEVQRAPLLLQAVKKDVDEFQDFGRFLLTGSANIQSLSGVTESLAGRVRKIRLRPLAVGETYKTKPLFVTQAFDGKFMPLARSDYDKEAYLREAFQGGFPEARRLHTAKERHQWHQDYLEAMMERDLKDITHIKRQDSMLKLVETLAAWSSKFMDIAVLSSNLSLSRATVESYINALEALYLVERVKPWHKTDYDRVGKREKLFMTDTGLMAAILRWRFDTVCLDGDLNGKLIETFVFNQLMALIDAQEDAYTLFHYRDREQREIDFLIENEEGSLLGIEVKAGSAVTAATFKTLNWFQKTMATDRSFTGVVLYTGEHVVSFGDHMWAIPISCLWGE